MTAVPLNASPFPTYPASIQVLLELRALLNVNSSITILGLLRLFDNLSLILTRNQDCSSSITCLWAAYLDSSYARSLLTEQQSHWLSLWGFQTCCCFCLECPVHPSVLTKTGLSQGAFPEPQNRQGPTLIWFDITLEIPSVAFITTLNNYPCHIVIKS